MLGQSAGPPIGPIRSIRSSTGIPEFFGVVKGGNQFFSVGQRGEQKFSRVKEGNQTTGFSQIVAMYRKAPSTNCTVSVY